jgi:hypothetical protein
MRARWASAVALFALACSLALFGCGDAGVIEEPMPPAMIAKTLLLQISEAGESGSGTMLIRENLEKLKATDAAKADQLIKELDQLEKTSNPAQVKALAKKMADKL